MTCDYTEQRGHGIPQIVKHYGKEAFSFRDGMLCVTLPFGYKPDYVASRLVRHEMHGMLSENQQKVLGYLKDHAHTSLAEVAGACSLSLGGVKKIVGGLQKMGMLERRGAKNSSQWIVKL